MDRLPLKQNLQVGTLAANIPSWRGLEAFLAVVQRRSFSAAARDLGVSPSALSQAVRALERDLGTPLLVRTTRAVNVTQAGAGLQARLLPAMESVRQALREVKPTPHAVAGRLRLTVPRIAIGPVLRPLLAAFCRRFPGVDLDIDVEERLVDIVAAGFDAGIRLSEAMERDMTAVRLTPPFRFVIVASPRYLRQHGRPTRPQDLLSHRCVLFRYPTSGTIYRWELEKAGRVLELAVRGQVTTSNDEILLQAALDGLGLAYVPEPAAQPLLRRRQLSLVLPDWCPTVPGLFLYFPRGAQNTPTLRAFLDTARQLLPR
jgi:DNA-binding transcriptional LysR family regulator